MVLVSAIGALALVTGVITLVTGSAVTLAILVASVAALWLTATARHTLARSARGNEHTPRSAPKTA